MMESFGRDFQLKCRAQDSMTMTRLLFVSEYVSVAPVSGDMDAVRVTTHGRATDIGQHAWR